MGSGSMRTNVRIPSARGGASQVLVGCLVVLVLVIGLAVAGGIYAANNWRGWVASGLEATINVTAEQAGLEQAQLTAVKEQITALMEDFRAERITFEQLVQVGDELTSNGDIFAMGMMQGLGSKYIEESALDDAAKADGRLAIQRFVRGLSEGSIEGQAVQQVLAPLQDTSGQGAIQISVNNISLSLKSPGSVTPEELTETFANLHATATAAGVPEDVEPFDFAAHLRGAIDRALGRAPTDGTGDSALDAPEGQGADAPAERAGDGSGG